MRYGFVMPAGDARTAADMAATAEAAGWDGFFVWDGVWSVDPWVSLTAAAMRTSRLRLGTMLTPLSRRRPWQLAAQTATLDHLSGGRLILSVGLGALDSGFAEFGEETDRAVRAELLDEGLDIVTGLWQGQPFNYSGRHYVVRETTFTPPPPPAQSPGIPIWVAAAWPGPRSMSRALRYDGLVPNVVAHGGGFRPAGPDDVRAMRAYADEHREGTAPFDIVVEGETPGDDLEEAGRMVAPLADAGATWWLETRWTNPDLAAVHRRLEQGPPQSGLPR